MTAHHAILWRRIDRPGHESGALIRGDSHWHLAGTAVFLDDGEPCRLDYLVVCDSAWRTQRAQVTGWRGARPVHLEVAADDQRHWRLDGAHCPDVTGALDVDLNFSPSTNLLPIRRLDLKVGEEAAVRAAWLRFPSFTLVPLEQRYRRVGPTRYRYESAGGSFGADLDVEDAGFVTRYPGLWEKEG